MNDLIIRESTDVESIRARIYTIRGVHVMLAPDLADLYQIETRIFNQAVKRNIERFPANFRFQLTKEEVDEVITICDNPDRLRFSPQTPYAFTEQGVAMLYPLPFSAKRKELREKVQESVTPFLRRTQPCGRGFRRNGA